MELALPGLGPMVSEAGASLPLFHDTFVGTTIYTDKFIQDVSTMAAAQTGGYLTLNSGASTVDAAFALVRTLRSFPLYQSFPVLGEWYLKTANDAEAQSKAEWGFGYNVFGVCAITDGVFFRLVVSGGLPRLQGVIVNNATETVQDLIIGSLNLPTPNVPHRYRIEIRHAHAVFMVDGVAFLMAVPAAQQLITSSLGQWAFALVFNNGSGATTARALSLAAVAVYARELVSNKQWGASLAGMGLGAHQVPAGSGVAVGQTANYVNSTAPASATLSNAVAGYATLGGQYQFAASATNETDWLIFAYTNRGPTETQTGRILHITGVRIGELVATGAAVVNATSFFWSLGVGSSSNSLATGDSNTGQAYKRIALGAHSFLAAAAQGAVAPGFHVPFDGAPLVVLANQRIAVAVKQLNGAATASLVWRGTVTLMGYFE